MTKLSNFLGGFDDPVSPKNSKPQIGLNRAALVNTAVKSDLQMDQGTYHGA